MPLKILVIPDKFKGTLTAGAAAEAIARGWRKARPLDALDLLPMCDGGDGFGEVMSALLAAKTQIVKLSMPPIGLPPPNGGGSRNGKLL